LYLIARRAPNIIIPPMSKYKKSGTPKHSGHIIKASQQALAALFEKFLYFVERRYRRECARARDCDSRSRLGNFQRAFCTESVEHREEKAEESVPRRRCVNNRHAEYFAIEGVILSAAERTVRAEGQQHTCSREFLRERAEYLFGLSLPREFFCFSLVDNEPIYIFERIRQYLRTECSCTVEKHKAKQRQPALPLFRSQGNAIEKFIAVCYT